jgi:hypothetical protein
VVSAIEPSIVVSRPAFSGPTGMSVGTEGKRWAIGCLTILSVVEVDLDVDVDILELLDPALLSEVAIDIKDDDTEPLPEA